MAFDPKRLPRVAWLVAISHIAGCGSVFKTPEPPAESGPVAKTVGGPRPAAAPGSHVVVGEMCPQGVAGRPGVAPLIMRSIQWTDAAAELTDVVERGSVPRFAVYGADGRIAGAFDTLGLADLGLAQPIASGGYTGATPCSVSGNHQPMVDGPKPPDDPRCVAATANCGLAVAELTRPGEPLDTLPLTVSGACVSGDALAVDIAGTGTPISFPLAGVLDGIRGPAAEWTAMPVAAPACKPSFQLYDITLAPEADPGKPVDKKAVVKLDVLGVLDLDGDGREELVLALRFPTVRSIVIYSASGSEGRLELVGEATSFAR